MSAPAVRALAAALERLQARRVPAFVSALAGVSEAEARAYLREMAEDRALVEAYLAGRDRVRDKTGKAPLPPRFWASYRCLYALVRAAKPARMIETGVHWGISSLVILSAMERNGGGALWSIDLSAYHNCPRELTGIMMPERLSPGWTFIDGDARREFPPLVGKLGRLDAFLHDSLHTYDFMTWEFDLVWPALRPGGF